MKKISLKSDCRCQATRKHAVKRAEFLGLLLFVIMTASSCVLRTQGDLPTSYAVSGGSAASVSSISCSLPGSAVSSGENSASSSSNVPSAALSQAGRASASAVKPSGRQTETVSWPASGPVPSSLTLPSLDGTKVFENSDAFIDLSYTAYGFVKIHLVRALQDNVKVWVHKGSSDYYYDLKNDGGTEIYPLQMGNGSYSISVLHKGSDGNYLYLASANIDVCLISAYDPFLVPNQIVCYNAGSKAVATARQLVSGMNNNFERISTVLSYVASHLSYDCSLAGIVKSGYVPDIDYALARGKGICYDYAAVSAAMLRCLGYPTKLMTGYVQNGSVYHAWNEVYIQGQGWIKVLSVKANMSGWSRVDVTFISGSTSSGTVAKYIGNGSNYSTVYVY